MSQGKWWLVTCTTFGTWLPGDPRGFQTWRGREHVPPPTRYAKPGEATYRAEEYSTEHRAASDSLSQEPVRFRPDQQKIATEAIINEIAETTVVPAIVALDDVHLHLLAKFGILGIRSAMGRFKAVATAQLHRSGLDSARIWTRGCHMRSKSTRDEFIAGFRYIQRHELKESVVHIWKENIPEDCSFLVPHIPLEDLPF